MRAAIGQVGAQGGLYIGDTADDLELVRRYRLTQQEHDPSILAAMVVHEHEVELYRQRGADILVRSVQGLLDVVPNIQ